MQENKHLQKKTIGQLLLHNKPIIKVLLQTKTRRHQQTTAPLQLLQELKLAETGIIQQGTQLVQSMPHLQIIWLIQSMQALRNNKERHNKDLRHNRNNKGQLNSSNITIRQCKDNLNLNLQEHHREAVDNMKVVEEDSMEVVEEANIKTSGKFGFRNEPES
jgi:hypothetical protein